MPRGRPKGSKNKTKKGKQIKSFNLQPEPKPKTKIGFNVPIVNPPTRISSKPTVKPEPVKKSKKVVLRNIPAKFQKPEVISSRKFADMSQRQENIDEKIPVSSSRKPKNKTQTERIFVPATRHRRAYYTTRTRKPKARSTGVRPLTDAGRKTLMNTRLTTKFEDGDIFKEGKIRGLRKAGIMAYDDDDSHIKSRASRKKEEHIPKRTSHRVLVSPATRHRRAVYKVIEGKFSDVVDGVVDGMRVSPEVAPPHQQHQFQKEDPPSRAGRRRAVLLENPDLEPEFQMLRGNVRETHQQIGEHEQMDERRKKLAVGRIKTIAPGFLKNPKSHNKPSLHSTQFDTMLSTQDQNDIRRVENDAVNHSLPSKFNVGDFIAKEVEDRRDPNI